MSSQNRDCFFVSLCSSGGSYAAAEPERLQCEHQQLCDSSVPRQWSATTSYNVVQGPEDAQAGVW